MGGPMMGPTIVPLFIQKNQQSIHHQQTLPVPLDEPQTNFNPYLPTFFRRVKYATLFTRDDGTQQIVTFNMFKNYLRLLLGSPFSTAPTPKQEFSRIYLLRLFFEPDDYYTSNHLRPAFIDQLQSLSPEEGMVLGGESFPFGVNALYINSEGPELGQRLAKQNVFVRQGLARFQLQQLQRVSSAKFGDVVAFYQMKMQK